MILVLIHLKYLLLPQRYPFKVRFIPPAQEEQAVTAQQSLSF